MFWVWLPVLRPAIVNCTKQLVLFLSLQTARGSAESTSGKLMETCHLVTCGLPSTPLLDTQSQTSLSTSPLGNPCGHLEVCSTSRSGRGKFIWTEPPPLDFDRGSESASYAHFRPLRRPQCNTIVMSSRLIYPHPTLFFFYI